jgi:hypothetical protein
MHLLPPNRRAYCGLVLLLLALAAASWCLPYPPREARYHGRPASWWGEEVTRWYSRGIDTNKGVDQMWTPTTFEQALARAGYSGQSVGEEDYRLADGDPAAVPVLVELIRYRDLKTRRLAATSLFWAVMNNGSEKVDAATRTAMEKAVGDEDAQVRQCARRAILLLKIPAAERRRWWGLEHGG